MMDTKDFDTGHLTLKQRKIADAILSVVRYYHGERASGGGCRAFYTPEEWRDRGEDYGTESELIVCHDGGDLAPFFNHVYRLEGSHGERMDEALAALGLYAEQCTSWYTAIYRI